MSVFKCKMCGGDVELTADKTLGTCEYCGCTMTFPKVDDDQRAAAFNRGNHFRRTGEFDKALSVYERIVNEDDNDAEAHWCCALCRFGIEYVEDPTTYEWLPTMHRLSYDSFLEDVDYLAAVEHSDGITKRQYQKDAMKIAEVQRGILATSQNEEPFDVFICYKESDENGNRTVDSSLAQDIYYQLTDKGYKVFFSRITLEDKVGTEYEPYIFAALNSAKVMLVIGTKPEYLNAVWVKNEWSRFIAMMKKDRKRVLLPCYRGMDPYDMPEALSVLQSYDMAKIGFIQDLIRGIEKIVSVDEPKAAVKETVVVQQGTNANTAPLLKRVFMFLEDGEWDSANVYSEKVLDIDPECAEAYLAKLMIEIRCRKRDMIKNSEWPISKSGNYQKAIRFGSSEFSAWLKKCALTVDERIRETELSNTYNNALAKMNSANNEFAFYEARDIFLSIAGYKDSNELAESCAQNAQECIYKEADRKSRLAYTAEECIEVAKIFKRIESYKDSRKLELKYIEMANEINEQKRIDMEALAEKQRKMAEYQNKRNKRNLIIIVLVCFFSALVIVLVYLLITHILPEMNREKELRNKTNTYNYAVRQIEDGDYYTAYNALCEIGNFKDSKSKKESIKEQYINSIKDHVTKGDEIYFGEYEQDAVNGNGKEDIKWIVLEKNDNQILVLSKYALDAREFDEQSFFGTCTWAESDIRDWLNNEFYDEAFDSDEQRIINSTTVTADINSYFETTNQGETTVDAMFLLSLEEAKQYIHMISVADCPVTNYCCELTGNNRKKLYWWLRTLGDSSNNVMCICADNKDTTIGLTNDHVEESNLIRPAMWINLG